VFSISIQVQCSCAEDGEHFKLHVVAQAENHTHKKRQRFCVYDFKLAIQRLASEPLNSKFVLRGLRTGSGGISSSRA
jgi:hypothetical protein